MSSGQTFKSSSAFQSSSSMVASKAAVKSEDATGEWRQAGDLASGILARIQKERMRQSALVASTANDPGAARGRAVPDRLAS
jgi:hypothetical protein